MPEQNSLRPEERIAKVVERHLAHAADTKAVLPELRSQAGMTNGDGINMKDTEAELEKARKQLDTVLETNVTEKNKLFGLRGLVGRGRREARETAARDTLKAAEEKHRQTTQIDKLDRAVVRDETIAEANRLGGPLEASDRMKESLGRQALVSKLLKGEEGYLKGSSDETEYLPTLELFNQIVDMLEVPKDWNGEKDSETREKAEKQALDMLPIIETINKYCQENDIKFSRRLMLQAIQQGMKITDGISGEDMFKARKYIENKKKVGEEEVRLTSSDIGYYEIGAFQLDRFFSESGRKNISGKNRIPFILAYAAGALHNKAPMYMVQHARDWIAESIPVPGLAINRTRRPLELNEEPTSLGLGHLISIPYGRDPHDVYRGQTLEPGMVEVAKQASEIVLSVNEAMLKRNRYDAQRHLNRGYSTSKLEVPTLKSTPKA